MQKVNKIIFWCEFPKEMNWKKFNKILSIDIDVYIASKTKQEFNFWKSKIKSKKVKKIGVWPVLLKKEGYWFSGYSSKEAIDKLNKFKGIDMKLDLEPPLFDFDYNLIEIIKVYTKLFLTKTPKNRDYLKNKIIELSKYSEIILSGFPFPDFLVSLYGDPIKNNKKIRRNYFIYSTLTPSLFRPIINLYYQYFFKSKLKKYNKILSAVGCLGHGILGNEPKYKNIKEFEKDLQFLLRNNIKEIVIFDLAGLMNRENPEQWFNILKKYQ